ncbi:MAG TPA: NADH-quinone oxidoreductase subunit C [Bryobacteraceae bacterium]|nr:NADH-quinone oxidoreductase subunit C [Bryobacteraceae bacterium]
MLPEALVQHDTARALDSALPGAIRNGKWDRGEVTLEVAPERIVEVCRFLKQERQFVRLSDVTAVDWYPQEPRFEVVYHLHSLERNERLRLKCRLNGGDPEVDSVTAVWRSANWYEREVYDLFGIRFRNHPDLRRILMPEDWEGHPLRKDYPVHGYKYSYGEQ